MLRGCTDHYGQIQLFYHGPTTRPILLCTLTAISLQPLIPTVHPIQIWKIGKFADILIVVAPFEEYFTESQTQWESGESKTLFNGISYSSEYDTVSPWMTLREMEEDMVEEIEAAGALFLRAGIVDSSRFSWNIATQHYAEKFNYAKLVIAYSNLARVVTSHVPSIDTSLPQEVTTTLGRFYRVWFHGGAPDDLNGVEFVYRSKSLRQTLEISISLSNQQFVFLLQVRHV